MTANIVWILQFSNGTSTTLWNDTPVGYMASGAAPGNFEQAYLLDWDTNTEINNSAVAYLSNATAADALATLQATGQMPPAANIPSYTLAQVTALNGQVSVLVGPDGVSYTPSQFALKFFNTVIPDLIPLGAQEPPAPPPLSATAPPAVYVPVPPPAVIPPAGSGPVATVPQIQSTLPPLAPPLPTPPAPAENVPGTISLTTTPTLPPQPPASSLPQAQCITVSVAGRQRVSCDLTDLQNVLDSGGQVVRADGTFAVIQVIRAPGWTGNSYLVDGNPLNVVLGQGWLPGQMDLVNQLAQAGATMAPTLGDQPNSAAAGAGASVFGGLSTGELVAAGLLVYFLFRKKG